MGCRTENTTENQVEHQIPKNGNVTDVSTKTGNLTSDQQGPEGAAYIQRYAVASGFSPVVYKKQT